MKKRKKQPRISKINLRAVIREATEAGCTAAIEHCANFWNVSDGYKKYIEMQIAEESKLLQAAMRLLIRDELKEFATQLKKRKRRHIR